MVRTFNILSAKVLIVDDQEAHVLLLERMLRGAGYTSVESTMNPREVCELHRQNRYVLILLDLKMPGMDGFQVIESLKEIETDDDLPVLVITAEPGEKLRALRAGARDFVSKPLDLAEVLMRVHNMIEVRLLRLEMTRFSSQPVEVQPESH
jgi:CheY-like chemotaxis protein